MSIHNNADLAAMEKESAGRLEMGVNRWVVASISVLYLVALFLPFVGDVPGWRLLTFTEPDGFLIAVTERLFTLLSFLCLAVFSLLMVVTQRTVFAMLAWMAGSVGVVMALLGLWLRQTSSTGVSTGEGFYIAIFALLAAIPALSIAWMRRTPEQKRIEELRRERTEFNPVAEVQTDAAQQAVRRSDGGEHIIDDRRKRAAERHGQAGER